MFTVLSQCELEFSLATRSRVTKNDQLAGLELRVFSERKERELGGRWKERNRERERRKRKGQNRVKTGES